METGVLIKNKEQMRRVWTQESHSGELLGIISIPWNKFNKARLSLRELIRETQKPQSEIIGPVTVIIKNGAWDTPFEASSSFGISFMRRTACVNEQTVKNLKKITEIITILP